MLSKLLVCTFDFRCAYLFFLPRRHLAVADGMVCTFAGSQANGTSDGLYSAATFMSPSSMVQLSTGEVFITDISANTMRHVSPDGVVSTVAGSGNPGVAAATTGRAASIGSPSGLSYDSVNNRLLIALSASNTIISFDLISSQVTTVQSLCC